MAWLRYWEVDGNTILEDINNLKNTITSKFKVKIWNKKDLEGKRKLRCYKEVINPNMNM